MPISQETKFVIRPKIEELKKSKQNLNAEIDTLQDKIAVLKTQRDEINIQITNLEVDLNG